MTRRRKPDPRQLSLALAPPPMIRGESTIGGVDLWYDRRTCCWVNVWTPECEVAK